MRRRLLDTGPLVAYVDAGDPAHTSVASAMDEFKGQLVTSTAVLTEAMHLLSDDPAGPELLVEFLVTTGTLIAEVTSASDLQELVRLTRKYSDTPMDFADATLVLLAGRVDVMEIFTIDRRGFSTYRTANGKAFRVFPYESRTR